MKCDQIPWTNLSSFSVKINVLLFIIACFSNCLKKKTFKSRHDNLFPKWRGDSVIDFQDQNLLDFCFIYLFVIDFIKKKKKKTLPGMHWIFFFFFSRPGSYFLRGINLIQFLFNFIYPFLFLFYFLILQ